MEAVDTTGAGDSFVGAFLKQIVDDQSVLEVYTQMNESSLVDQMQFTDIGLFLLN